MVKPARGGSVSSDRGAAAVEFALLLPLLVLIVFGLIDFGRAINAQITLTQAAREGARSLALGQSTYQSRAQAAAIGLSGLTVTELPDSLGVIGCPAGSAQTGDDAVVHVTYTFSFITPIGTFFGPTKTLTAEGVMPCET
ncbi:MAG TPA: TadE family protein [Streptosporangiaceae bacterium]|jgi:Flp pilus assembly pilin Flp